nr:hypothetical protein [Tanacetum cinerariifolium]
TPRTYIGTGYDRQIEEYDNQMVVNVIGARENVGTQGHCKRYTIVMMTNLFANKRQHPEQPESVNDTYLMEQGDTNINHDSSDMSNNREKADQDDQTFQKERELLAFLIDQMNIEIYRSKQHNKTLESSNKVIKEASTFLQSELKRYQDTDYVKNAREKCAMAYVYLKNKKLNLKILVLIL